MKYVFDKRHLEAEMLKANITRKKLANELGIAYSTINAKFNGTSEWGYTECLLIRDVFFPDFKVDDIFKYSYCEESA